MTWKHSKNDDLIISSEMSLDAPAMKRSVLADIMDTVRCPLPPAPWLLKEHYGLENWGQS